MALEAVQKNYYFQFPEHPVSTSCSEKHQESRPLPGLWTQLVSVWSLVPSLTDGPRENVPLKLAPQLLCSPSSFLLLLFQPSFCWVKRKLFHIIGQGSIRKGRVFTINDSPTQHSVNTHPPFPLHDLRCEEVGWS